MTTPAPLPGPQYFIQYELLYRNKEQYAIDEADLDRILKRIRSMGAGSIFVWKRVSVPE